MKSLDEVRTQFAQGEFELSLHALRRAVERDISFRDLREAGLLANIIEEYPTDKYAPSCLLLGFTDSGRPLHIHVSLFETELVRVITVYEPDPETWSDFSTRR